MGIPQIIFLALVALIMIGNVLRLGEKIPPRPYSVNTNMWAIFVNPIVWIGLTYWGGFFDG